MKKHHYNKNKKTSKEPIWMKILRLVLSFLTVSFTAFYLYFFGIIGYLAIGIGTFMFYHTVFAPYDTD